MRKLTAHAATVALVAALDVLRYYHSPTACEIPACCGHCRAVAVAKRALRRMERDGFGKPGMRRFSPRTHARLAERAAVRP